jgi:hypothetical protein
MGTGIGIDMDMERDMGMDIDCYWTEELSPSYVLIS